jgi:hypothetical protein
MNSQSFKDPDSPGVWKRAPFQLLTLGVVILAVAVIAMAWYAYPRFRQQAAGLADLSNLRNVVNTLEGRLDASASKLQSWTDAQQQLRDQLNKTEQRLTARINKESKESKVALDSSRELLRRAEAQTENRVPGIQAQVTRLESSKPTEDPRVAQLQREIGNLRERVDYAERNLTATRNEFQLEAAARDRQFGDLQRREDRNRQRIESTVNDEAVRRIDFEIGRNHTNEIAPGIWLRITRANQNFSNVEGWMRIKPEDRTFWFHRQSAEEPLIFYGRKDDRKRELVVTRVRSNAVTGYLILPKADAAAKQVASAPDNVTSVTPVGAGAQ